MNKQKVRFPEAYRRLYWRIIEAMDPFNPAPLTEEEADRRTSAVLDLFEDSNPDLGPAAW